MHIIAIVITPSSSCKELLCLYHHPTVGFFLSLPSHCNRNV